VARMKCDYCGEDKEDVEYTENAYARGVYNESYCGWYCRTCLDQMADDV